MAKDLQVMIKRNMWYSLNFRSMRDKNILLVIKLFLILFIVITFASDCKGRKKEQQETKIEGDVFKDVFGDIYRGLGDYWSKSKDSVENGLWSYTNLNRPLAIYGNYYAGIPTGDWNFVFDNGSLLTSKWTVYRNKGSKCEFSLPFAYQEEIDNPSVFKLTTINDSLGKVTILVSVSDTVIKEQDLEKFGKDTEIFILEQGYKFTSNVKGININNSKYFFTEYFMKDSVNRDCKLYRLYGYPPSKKYFVDFAVFHLGPKEDVVKIIYNLMATSFYVDNERFYNPHIHL